MEEAPYASNQRVRMNPVYYIRFVCVRALRLVSIWAVSVICDPIYTNAFSVMFVFLNLITVGLRISYFEYIKLIKHLIRLSHNMAYAQRKKEIANSNSKTPKITAQDSGTSPENSGRN